MYTYILGAGASFDTLPLAADLNKSIALFRKSLYDYSLKRKRETSFTPNDKIDQLIAEIDDLLDQSGNHQTIDTYAKMLWLTKEITKYNRLRILLTLYFIFEQSLKKVHNRYDHFLATLLEEQTLKIPESFCFLSWNYDYQFEKAMSLYIRNQNYLNCCDHLRLNPYRTSDNSGKSFFKLNGTAFILPHFRDSSTEYSNIYSSQINNEAIKYILKIYEDTLENNIGKTSLSFAWEADKESIIDNNIRAKLSQTKVLVVIGYSFPYFNRTVDLKILSSFSGVTLEKILIQAPEPSASQMKSKVESILPKHLSTVQVSVISDTTQFFIPYEFNNLSESVDYNVTTFLE